MAGGLFPWLQQPGSLTAWRCSERQASYDELQEHLAQHLSRLPSGAILATHAPNSPELLEILLAALLAGRTVFPQLHRWPPRRACELAQLFGASALWTPTHGWEILPSQPTELPPGQGTLLLTSGSSGFPKAVWHPLSAHLASAFASQTLLPVGPGSQWLLDLSLAHVSGLAVVIRCLAHGGTVVFPSSPKSPTWPPGITHLSVVSTQLSRLLEQDDLGKSPPLLLAGGGPFAPQLLRRALARGLPIFLSYGMTEAASQICTRRLQPADCASEEIVGCGPPLPGWEVRSSIDQELQIRGPALAPYYLLPGGKIQPLGNAEGWFSTRDIGDFAPESGWKILGRRDRMFISGGENIHPEQIEHLLMQCPGVVRVRVLAKACSEYGFRPIAFVAGDFSREALLDFLSAKVPRFALPAEIKPWPTHLDPHQPKLREEDFPAS